MEARGHGLLAHVGEQLDPAGEQHRLRQHGKACVLTDDHDLRLDAAHVADALHLRVDEPAGNALWTRQLTIGQELPRDPLVPQLSDMLVFDFLINNVDRWSGGNVRCSPDGKQLYFMDNAMAFAPAAYGHVKVRARLLTAQRFSRKLYRALVDLDVDDVTDTMVTDTGWWPRLLSKAEVTALMARRDHMVAYIDALIAQHGASRVLVFP